jgi:hypothetical protein
MAAITGELTVWINAFIPSMVPGYTVTVTNGPNAGKTAVPLPGIARLNPLNLFKDWSAGYLTDQRNFSDVLLPDARARMTSFARISIPSATAISVGHRTSGTTQVNMDSGATTGIGKADLSRCIWGTLTQAPIGDGSVLFPGPGLLPTPQFPRAPVITTNPNVLKISVKGQASDPLVSAAADIDYHGTFTLTLDPAASTLVVSFIGLLDSFPAFEAYASLNGQTKALFTSLPPPGNTVTDLLGDANRPIQGSVLFP